MWGDTGHLQVAHDPLDAIDQGQGKKEEARRMLAGIHGWFTEGFDTADLQEASALLAELAGPTGARGQSHSRVEK